jgi:hypothetical protein
MGHRARSSFSTSSASDETTGLVIFLRGDQRLVKGGTVSGIEPVARIEEQEINFSSFRELRRLVQQKPTCVNAGRQSHVKRIPKVLVHATTTDTLAAVVAGRVGRRDAGAPRGSKLISERTNRNGMTPACKAIVRAPGPQTRRGQAARVDPAASPSWRDGPW